MKEAVLLLNMGGPNSIEEVELFLRNMFADPYILPVAPWLRKRIGNRIVRKRLREAQEAYRFLGGKSPLLEITQRLADKVQAQLGIPVLPTMRYVPPFADEVVLQCKQKDVKRLILFPMYPHYSTTTTRSSVDDVKRACEAIGYFPTITVVDPYFAHRDYIALIADRIVEALGDNQSETYDLILSAHGLPMKIVQSGDAYEKHIEGNVAALKLYLQLKGIGFHAIKLAYQSRVGRGKWLEPSLSDTLRNPTRRKVVIYPLSFTVDNSETLFELEVEHREIADKLRFADYRVARCFNDDARFVSLICDLVDEVR